MSINPQCAIVITPLIPAVALKTKQAQLHQDYYYNYYYNYY